MGAFKVFPAAVSGPEELLSLSFPSLATDDWSGNTAGADVTETIGDFDYTAVRNAAATTFGIVNGTGWQVNGNGSSNIHIDLSTLIPDYAAGDHLIMRLTLAHSGSGLANAMRFRIEDSSSSNFNSVQLLQSGGNFGFITRTNRAGNIVAGTLSATQASAPTSARLQFDYCSGLMRLRGDLDAGFALPAIDALTELRDAVRPNQSDVAAGGLDIASSVLKLQVNPGGSSIVTTFKELNISRLRRA